MIFVNYGGAMVAIGSSTTVSGMVSPACDLVFPWFIWIMGVSIVFSYKGHKKDSFLKRLYQVIRTTIILFALGLFLNVEGTLYVVYTCTLMSTKFSSNCMKFHVSSRH